MQMFKNQKGLFKPTRQEPEQRARQSRITKILNYAEKQNKTMEHDEGTKKQDKTREQDYGGKNQKTYLWHER